MLCTIATLVLLLISGNSYRAADLDDSFIDHEVERLVEFYRDHPALVSNIVYIDSSVNVYGFWTSMHDPIKGRGDTIVVHMRLKGDGSLGSGALGLIWTIDGGSSWTIDWPINDSMSNDPYPDSYNGRYPTACICPDFPAASWPDRSPGVGWGNLAVGNEPSWTTLGFYGIIANPPVHKNWSWFDESSDLIVGSGQDEGDNNWVWRYDPSTGGFETEPYTPLELAGFNTYAFDERNGNYLLLGFHSTLGGIAYSVSNSGILWTPPDSLMPPGQPPGWTVLWIDGAFLPNGDPAMAVMDLDATGGLDQSNEVWFFRPDTAVRIDAGLDTYNHYSQLALDRETSEISVVWAEATHEEFDPSIHGWRHDIYYSTSADGGYTWSTPQNHTNSPDINETHPHVARYNRSMIYVTPLNGSQADMYWSVVDDLAPVMWEIQMYVDIGLAFGIEESDFVRPNDLKFQVRNYLKDRRLVLNFNLPQAATVEARVFDAAGRCMLSKTSELGAGEQEVILETRSLPTGTYVVVVDVIGEKGTGKFTVF
jgi:hypothetical protein